MAQDADAQTAPRRNAAANAANPTETIVVTAQRRKESTLDVNASVTVVNSETITENNIQGIQDFFALVPNVSSQSQGGNGGGARSTTISMRGITDQGAGGERVAAQSAFAFYVDEVSVGNSASATANPPLYDIESIEVLRGPQGIFFGRNAEAGAINIQTRKPAKKFFGQIDLGVGTQGAVMTNAIVNLPLSDSVFLRQTLQKQRDNGAVQNLGASGGNSGSNLASGRTALRWLAGANTTLDLSFTDTSERRGVMPFVATGLAAQWGQGGHISPARTGNVGFYPDNTSHIYIDGPEYTDATSKIYTARLEHRFEGMTFTSVTGRTDGTMKQAVDLDGSGVSLINRANDYTASSVSQEFRLASAGKRTLDWTVGAYAYADRDDFANAIQIVGTIFGWVPGDIANGNRIHIRRNGSALFGDLKWNASEQLSLDIGARASRDEDHQYWTDVTAANSAIALPPGAPPVPGTTYYAIGDTLYSSGGQTAQTIGTDGRNSGNDFSPSFGLNYKLNKSLSVYGTVSQGYKAPGVRANPDSGLPFPNISQYNKEKLTNYELGIKGVLFGNTRIEASVFNEEWRDFQVQDNETWCALADGTVVNNTDGHAACVGGPIPLNRIVNAGSARSRGLDLSLQTRVTPVFLIGGTLGLLDAKFGRFVNGPNGDTSGAPMNGAPKTSGTLFVQYSGELGDGSYYVRPWIDHKAKFYNIAAPTNYEYQIGDIIPARTLLNLSAGYSWGNNTLTLTGANLAGKKYYTNYIGSVVGRMVDVHPRTLMLRLTVATN